MKSKQFVQELIKTNGKDAAKRIAEECLRYSLAGSTISYADEMDARLGDVKGRRVSGNINFWKTVNSTLKNLK